MQDKNTVRSTLEQLKEAQLKRIRRVVCSGGGAKGVVYPGSYKAMEDTGVFAGVEELSGASAGAITSAMLAFGMPSSEFRKKLLTTNLKDLMGDRVGSFLGSNPPGIAMITKDGKPLENFIRENIITTVRTNLAGIDNLEALAKANPELQQLLTKLQSDTPVITFRDLETLNHHFPDKFKQLNMPAVQFPNGEVQIFNSKLTPDVEVALACRASASIPVILEPVTIEINGVTKRFVDGGMFDNLPTDYFDLQEDGSFAKNSTPEQTLVFAFGEGLKNEDNQVFQALYGQRWDELVEDQLFDTLIRQIVKLNEGLIAPLEAQTQAIDTELNKLVVDKAITAEEAKVIGGAIKESISNLLLKPQENEEFWSTYRHENTADGKSTLLVNYIKEQMKPVLYNAGMIEQLKRNTLLSVLGDLTIPYKNTDQKEQGYHKLRSEYALRTVELRVGDIKTTSFDEATKVARVMDALGYLDTIGHITNHDLHDPDVFNADKFYVDTVARFNAIYQATISGAGKNIKTDTLVGAIHNLETELSQKGLTKEQIARQVFQLIKDNEERDLKSPEAFALSRAVEFHNKVLNEEELFKETYEESFKRSGHLAVSNITGETINKSNTLHEKLKDKNMFELYLNQPTSEHQTRMDKVFAPLQVLFNQHPNQQGIAEYNAKLKALETALATFNSTHASEKDQQFYAQGQAILASVNELAKDNTHLVRPSNLAKLTQVLSLATKTLEEVDDKKKTASNVEALAKLSQSVPGKSSAWQKVGYALLAVACAALLCVGILAAIPSGGSSLLLTAIGATGLSVAAAAGVGAGVVTATAATSAILITENSEKGLASEISKFKNALREINKENNSNDETADSPLIPRG